ncbi:MAG: T9SS type A sorting domain-containing protein [Bacteroidetes bacterium]|nr:T9SS type A sorting domain-containing protein [Bacteroidota bacterium]
MKYIFSVCVLMSLSTFALAQSPLVFSIGTNHVPGEVAHYASLKAACDSLNDSSGVLTSDHLYYITSSLTEPTNVNIGLNTNGHTITFKPYTGTTDTITFTQTADNNGLSGQWVIGVKNLTTGSGANYGLTENDSTDNIVIDGSNTDGGTTRDLSISNVPGTSLYDYTVRVFGNCDNIIIKNLNITLVNNSASGIGSYGFAVTVRHSNAAGETNVDYVPHDITLDNCNISNTTNKYGQGIYVSPSGTPTHFPDNIVFSNNKITATTRGFFLYYAGNTDIYGNDISLVQPSAGFLSEGIFAFLIGSSSDTTNIYDNNISLLQTGNTTAQSTLGGYGLAGMWITSAGVYNVYNNTISNFVLPSLAQGTYTGIGIQASTTGLTANVYYNSVYMANTNTAGASPIVQSPFIMDMEGAGTQVANVKDNIFASNVTKYATYAMYVTSGNTGTLNSDYNLLYAENDSAKTGNYAGTVCTTLSDWQTASSKDSHSVSGPAEFVSPTDLHIKLSALPVSAANNAGTPISGITTDADGNTRNATHPDIGAYEFTPSAAGISVVTIAQAKVESNGYTPDHLALGDTLMIYGVVTSPNLGSTYTSYYIQDTTAGIDVYKGGTPMSFNIGDSVFVIGKILQNKGLTEISPLVADSAHFGLIKHGAMVPKPKVLSIHDYLANAETYEGSLVEIDSAYKSSGTWGSNKSINVANAAHTDSTVLYINSQTNVANFAEPPYPINFVGLASQYTSSTPANNGYEIIPRAFSDLGILTVPSAPTVIAVGKNVQRADTLVLKWHPAASFPVKYQFQLAKESAFSTLVVNDSTLTDTTEIVTGLNYSTKYYWHVNAYDAGGHSAFSMTDTFTTNMQPPAAPVLFVPAGTGVPRKPTFSWHPAARAVRYVLQVSGDSKFATLRENITVLPPDTSAQITDTLAVDAQYYWRVGAIDTGGTTYSRISLFTTGAGVLGVNQGANLPKEFALHQNYPNPFNPTTMIKFDLPKEAEVQIVVYNVLGQRVATLVNERMEAGYQQVVFNGDRLASGVYFVIMRAANKVFKDKMMLLK